MVPPVETKRHGPASTLAHATPAREKYCGEIVYIYAFDVAYDMKREPVKGLLGQPVQQVLIDSSKRAPRQHLFYRPQMVHLPAVERTAPRMISRRPRASRGNRRPRAARAGAHG